MNFKRRKGFWMESVMAGGEVYDYYFRILIWAGFVV